MRNKNVTGGRKEHDNNNKPELSKESAGIINKSNLKKNVNRVTVK